MSAARVTALLESRFQSNVERWDAKDGVPVTTDPPRPFCALGQESPPR
jgi:hypothetical protein